ncbi:MAG: hypothetical protein H7A50_13745 [Akkermansiaceae bacterium]|nr:hypothetical protein [Akkermansiaceae bacterium]
MKPLATRPSGFALVVTLSLMILIALLSVGLLSLATISLRTAGASSSTAEARANARLALMMAVGQLQKVAGQDQRVTASAGLGGSTTNSRWVGVWRTTVQEDGSEPVVDWSPDDTGLMDARVSQRLRTDSLFDQWLVSGDASTDPDRATGEMLQIVRSGTVSNDSDQVSVPLVTLKGSGDKHGAYAYWCSDESMKASLNVPEGEKPDGVEPPDRHGIEALAGLEGYKSVKDEDLGKVLDYRQAELAAVGNKDALRNHFHAVGTRASAVLSDTVRGGLKRDLSAFIETGSAPAHGTNLPAVNERTPLFSDDSRSKVGPKFGVLRSYAKLAERTVDGEVEVTAPPEPVGGDKFGALPDQKEFIGQPVHPVLAQAEIYTRVAYLRGYATVHIYPRVVLWNPYNVKLASSDYTVDFNICLNDSMVFEKDDRGQRVEIANGGRAFDTRGNKDNRMSFTLEATSFEPGEALVFSAKPVGSAVAGRAVPLAQRSGSGSNLLSSTVDPRQLTNFYLVLGNNLSGVSSGDLPIYANHNKGSYYWVDMMDWWERNPDNGLKISLHLGSAGNYSSRLRLPLLQLLDTDNWRRGYEGGYNNGRWRVGGIEPVYNYESTADLEPWTRSCYGIRYKWWVERNPYNLAGTGGQRYWSAAVTGDYNLRAPYCHRSPFDAVTDNGESHHWYMWGPYACEREQGLPFLSPERAAHDGPNGFRGNPFYGGASTQPSTVYPIYDLPQKDERIVSLGRFQNAQITPYVWHTNFPIGNSWIPSNQLSDDRTAEKPSTMKAAWQNYVTHLPAWMKQGRGDEVVVYDLSYEANHELWDRYFLSGATTSEKQAFLADPSDRPLPNHLLYMPADSSPDIARLGDFYQAASQLLLAGAFNVNTTDVNAWKALFASMNERRGSGATFARTSDPGGEQNDASDPYEQDAWSGFRSLSDQEIDELANAMVIRVKDLGPFLSVSDFVNRRLARRYNTDSGMGPLQAAIENAGLNDGLSGGDLNMSTLGWAQSSYEPGSSSGEWVDKKHLRKTKGVGMPTYLQQGDLLQPLGSMLVARGDTFVVRAYGDSRTKDGTIMARAWCEAEVQRMPSYVNPADAPEEPPFVNSGGANDSVSAISRRFGRQFRIVSFRWLASTEV